MTKRTIQNTPLEQLFSPSLPPYTARKITQQPPLGKSESGYWKDASEGKKKEKKTSYFH